MSATLNQTLATLGYATGPSTAKAYAKAVLRDGAPVFEGTAHEVWQWLRTRGEVKP